MWGRSRIGIRLLRSYMCTQIWKTNTRITKTSKGNLQALSEIFNTNCPSPQILLPRQGKAEKKCKDSKNLCGKAICWDYVLVGLSSFPCPALWVYCKTEPSLEEEAPSVRARKLQRISGGFFARSTNPTNQPTNQPNHPTIHLIHHSTHSFQDVANLLHRYLIQDLNHSWAFNGESGYFFTWQWNVPR